MPANENLILLQARFHQLVYHVRHSTHQTCRNYYFPKIYFQNSKKLQHFFFETPPNPAILLYMYVSNIYATCSFHKQWCDSSANVQHHAWQLAQRAHEYVFWGNHVRCNLTIRRVDGTIWRKSWIKMPSCTEYYYRIFWNQKNSVCEKWKSNV